LLKLANHTTQKERERQSMTNKHESRKGLTQSFKMKIPAEKHQIDTLLFSCPQMEELTQRISTDERISKTMRINSIIWKKFEDGFPNLMIQNIDDIKGREAVFFADFLDPVSMFEQLAVIYALPRYFVKSLTVVLPYFPTGTMERVDEEGQIATAKTLAVILSAIPLSSMGPSKLMIYDIHALQERFYFGNNVIPVLLSAIPLFKEQLKKCHKDDNVCIAFPDDGACKRFGKMFKKYPVVICAKVREGDKRIVTVKEGNPKGHHVFIVDDLVKTGGTLIECKNALLKHGAKKVSAFVTHAVFPLESWKRFAEVADDQFQCFYITDSCPTVVKILQGKKPFEVLSLKDSLIESMLLFRS